MQKTPSTSSKFSRPFPSRPLPPRSYFPSQLTKRTLITTSCYNKDVELNDLACSRVRSSKSVLAPSCQRHIALGLVVLATSAQLSFITPLHASAEVPAVPTISYEETLKRRKSPAPYTQSNLPSSGEAEALLSFDKDLFTEDGWKGMVKVAEYSRYLESREVRDAEASCSPQCAENRELLEKAFQIVANEYYDPAGAFSQEQWAGTLLRTLQDHGGVLRSKAELHAALRDMTASLHDPYTKFLTSTEFRRAILRPRPAERLYLDVQMVGPGVLVGQPVPSDGMGRPGGYLIEAPVPESPAETAGLLRHDLLLAVDGVAVGPGEGGAGPTPQNVRALLRGPLGSTVALTVAHPRPLVPFLPFKGPEWAFNCRYEVRELELDRAYLTTPPLSQGTIALEDGSWARYIRLKFFSSEASQQLKRAIRAGEREGVAGYIIDLRNNPGGVFEEAVGNAAFFLGPSNPASTRRFSPESLSPPPPPDPAEPVPITYTFRNDSNSEERWRAGELPRDIFLGHPGRLTSRPLVLLVNGASASSSEVLTGALMDNGRAIVVGEQTFGKGKVQYYFPLGSEGGLKVTVAKYVTPSGHDISLQGGIRPQIACSDHPRDSLPSTPEFISDSCLRAAVASLEAQRRGSDL